MMKVEYVNPFISATVQTISTMLNIEAKNGKPQLTTKGLPSYDVAGIIGLTGDAIGSIALNFPEKVVLELVSKLLGTKLTAMDKDVSDAIGELANIVAGYAKKDLTNLKVSISLPNVVMGKEIDVESPSSVPTIYIPFSTELGEFTLKVSLQTK